MNYEVNRANRVELQGVMDEPPLYRVYIHNDDFTPMEFVLSVIEQFFFMDRRAAAEVMLAAHVDGRAACGTYSRDCAEAKIAQITNYARSHEYPLLCSMEVLNTGM